MLSAKNVFEVGGWRFCTVGFWGMTKWKRLCCGGDFCEDVLSCQGYAVLYSVPLEKYFRIEPTSDFFLWANEKCKLKSTIKFKLSQLSHL